MVVTKLTTKSGCYFWSVIFVSYLETQCTSPLDRILQHGSPRNVLVIGLCSFLHIFGLFLKICLLPPPLSTNNSVWQVPGRLHWGNMVRLQGFPAMEALYSLGDSWSQWKILDIPGLHLPYSMIQLLKNLYTGNMYKLYQNQHFVSRY